MGLSGLIGAGANEGLEDLLARQLLQQQQAESMRARQAQESMQQQRIGLDTRRQDFEEQTRQEDIQQSSIADMRGQNDKMDARLSRLQGEEDQRDAEEQLKAELAALLPTLPPSAQNAVKLQMRGVKGVSAEDLRTPDEIAAADKRDIEQYATKMGAGAEAQARAAAKYREPKPEGPGGLQPSQVTTAKQFQDDYYRDSKTYVTVRNAFQQVAGAAKNPDAAGDLSLIFGYMKMLDPNSVVRETEFANAQNAAGVPDQVRNLYNRAISGQRLNPRQRDQFVGQAQRIMQSAHENQQRVRKTYGDRSSKFGIDPTMVLDDEEPMPGGEAPAPASGDGLAGRYERGPDGKLRRVP